jgi:hypothetical protein
MKMFSSDRSSQCLLHWFKYCKGAVISLVILLSTFLFTGCQKQDLNAPKDEAQLTSNSALAADLKSSINTNGLTNKTVWELQQARAATARYRNIKNAFKDGYADINVVVPNMGYHFMKSELTADGVFDVRKPEILVYNKNEDGSFELGAVEYAVPIDVTPNVAPDGFTGSADVWERNTDFGLWLVHAWVWKYNPDGTFNPTNPSVIVH